MLEVVNSSKTLIEEINIRLRIPKELEMRKGSLDQGINILKSDERKVLSWEFFVRSPGEVIGFEINITSRNGGNSVIRKGIEIKEFFKADPKMSIYISK